MINRPPETVEFFLKPLSLLYGGVMKIRNEAYERHWLPSFALGVPVLSIGNLTAGGTGKTPLTALIVEGLLERGVRVGVISRGYGGRTRGNERVRCSSGTGGEEVARFGDEPTWLASRFPGVPVYVGSNKVEVARTLLRNENVQLVVADDAFQHRRLKRAMDIVVIDATEPPWHYRPLPLGRMREGFASLNRAQVVFLTKLNLADPYRIKALREHVDRFRSSGSLVIETESVIPAFDNLGLTENSGVAAGELSEKKLVLASGIGRPETFQRLIESTTRGVVLEHIVFKDHHSYSKSDLSRIEDRVRSLKADALIVTEKDAVKMKDWKPSMDCYVSRLVTRPRGNLGAFYDAVARLLL